MTTIFHTASLTRIPRGQTAAKRVWRDIGLGLTVSLMVLTMTVAGFRVRSDADTNAWPVVEAPQPAGGWEYSVPPDLLPLSVLPPDTSR
jgi:hypothetical protein